MQSKDASPLHRDAIPIAIFLTLTGVMTNPLVLHLANAVEDKQDALLNTWIIAWVGHALITDPLNLFNTNIFSPYLNTLAYSETLLPQGLFALPFNLAFDNTVLGYNLVLLASFFLAAYAMYLFVFDLTRNRGAGIVAGIIFAFNPYNLGNLAQVQLLSFGWMPLVLLSSQETAFRSQKSKVRYQILFLVCIFLLSPSPLVFLLRLSRRFCGCAVHHLGCNCSSSALVRVSPHSGLWDHHGTCRHPVFRSIPPSPKHDGL